MQHLCPLAPEGVSESNCGLVSQPTPIGYDKLIGTTDPKNVYVNEWQAIPTNIFVKRFDMQRTMVGRLPRQVDEPIYSERCGALSTTATAAGSASIRRRAIQKTMRGVFVAPWMVVRTEGGTS
jgi:hypothetical protein